MNHTDPNPSPEAPTLEKFFTTLAHSGAVNYCVVCLRTQQERKLVHNKALKLFSTAMKMDKDWKDYLVCHICESQAVKALKFYRAAAFAAAIDTIFAELILQKKSKKKVFEKENFKNILDKYGLGEGKTSPGEWEAELKVIRKSTSFNKTQQLHVDNYGQYPLLQKTLISNEILIIPDDPPDSSGQVTSITARSRGNTINPDADTLTDRNAEGHGGHRQITTRPPKGHVNLVGGYTGSVIPVPSARDGSMVIIQPSPQTSETFVILDDDEGKDFDIKIEKTLPDTMTLDPLLTATTPMTPQNLPANTKDLTKNLPAPKLVPLEKLLEKPKEILTGDGLLLGTLDGNYSLHPIAIKEGVTTIPSLQANVINNSIVSNTIRTIYPVGDKPMTSEDLVQAPTQMLPLPLNTVFSISNGAHASINYAALLITNTVKKPPDTGDTIKRSLDSNEIPVTPTKKIKMLPVKNAANDRSRIDWEDKIPADVISFVDAVDPNPDPKMTPRSARSIVPSQQAQLPIQKAAAKNTVCDVVDLC